MKKISAEDRWAKDAVRRMLVRVCLSISTDYALLAKMAARR